MFAELSIYLPGILLSYAAFLLGIVSPGPNVMAVIGTSMEQGRYSGIALAMGVATGSLTWAVLTVVGLTTLLANFAIAFTVIKIAGGLYLLWLSYKAFKSASSKTDILTQQKPGKKRSKIGFFVRGYVVQMTNPKAAFAWIAIVTLGMQPGAPFWVGAAIALGTFVLSVICHLVYALLFSTQTMVKVYANARRTIQATLGAFFALAGIKLLVSRT